jgi:hypothetical protein
VANQPDGIMNIESCRLSAYTSYADIYKAVISFFGQDSPLPVSTVLVCLECVVNIIHVGRDQGVQGPARRSRRQGQTE